jgi:hypothetical protein
VSGDNEDPNVPGPPLTKSAPSSRRGRRAPSDRAFDLWLDQGLHAMFDEVAKEPIPDELLRLIERDRKD